MDGRGAVLLDDVDAGQVTHPEFVTIAGAICRLVEDPLLDCIAAGDTVLGWEGDARMAVYINPPAQCWELVRVCADGSISSVMRISAGSYRLADLPALFVGWLVTHDNRRGWNPFADVVAAEQSVAADADRARHDLVVTELAPRLKRALVADGV